MFSEIYTRMALIVLLATLLVATCSANPYLDNDLNDGDVEEYDTNMDKFLQDSLQDKRSGGLSSPAGQIYMPMRRACIRRGGNCDNRQEDCCYNSTCRCNLFGYNCKCQRLGLFQKWGK